MKVINCLDPQTALKKAGEALDGALRNVEGNVLLFISGGSSLNVLRFVERIPRHLTIALVDERISQRPEDSNWHAFTQTNYYRNAHASGVIFLPIPTHGSVHESAVHYEQNVRKIFQKDAGRVLALLGVGTDGHIAGVMPYPKDEIEFENRFLDPDRWVVGYDASGKSPYPHRVTLSLDFLKMRVHQSIVAAFGVEKYRALERTVARTGAIAETPARILRSMNKVQLFTDIGVCSESR